MRKIQLTTKDLHLRENVEVIYERRVTAFGNSAKIDSMKKYIGRRVYIIIVKD